MNETRTILLERNSLSLRTGIVQDDGQVVYLVLLPPESSTPLSPDAIKSSYVPLYRRKASRFSEILFLFGRAAVGENTQNPHIASIPTAKGGLIHVTLRKLAYRYFLLKLQRSIKPLTPTSALDLRLLWAGSGQSVAVLLSGEPWGFLLGQQKLGYSKGILRGTIGNSWDQELFDRTFGHAE